MTVTDKTTANGVTVEHQLGARKARTSVRPIARLHAGTEIGPWQKTEMLTGTSAWAQCCRTRR